MTSTSFQSPTSGCRGALCNTAGMRHSTAERDEALHAGQAPSYAHAAETRRMKAFTGQCKFRAPVADDFFVACLSLSGLAGMAPRHRGTLGGSLAGSPGSQTSAELLLRGANVLHAVTGIYQSTGTAVPIQPHIGGRSG